MITIGDVAVWRRGGDDRWRVWIRKGKLKWTPRRATGYLDGEKVKRGAAFPAGRHVHVAMVMHPAGPTVEATVMIPSEATSSEIMSRNRRWQRLRRLLLVRRVRAALRGSL